MRTDRQAADACEICQKAAGLDRHHLGPRGMGGSKDPEVLGEENIITLCRACHRNIHEDGWQLERSPALLRVVDKRTGAEIMRRHLARDFDPAALLQPLSRLNTFLSQALQFIRYLDDEQLVEAFPAARSLGKRSWLLQAAILHEVQRRSAYGDRSLEAIARRFEISLRQAQKYALVWRLFFAREETGAGNGGGDPKRPEAKNVNLDAFFFEEPSWYVVAATESPEPQRWLAYAQDRKAEDPGTPSATSGATSSRRWGRPRWIWRRAPRPSPRPRGRSPWDCPWVKPYCTRSGRPVPIEERPCEEAVTGG